MPGEDTPLKHKSSESVTDADVQRLLNIALAGAGVVEGLTPPKTQSGTTTLYGEYRIHHDKPFQKYAELSMVSPHVFIPLAKLGLSLVSGYRPKAKEGKKTLTEKIDEWVRRSTRKTSTKTTPDRDQVQERPENCLSAPSQQTIKVPAD